MSAPAILVRLLVAGSLVGVGVAATLTSNASAQPDEPAPVETRTVVMVHRPDDPSAASPILDQLAPQTVLTVHASDFPSDTTGVVAQCVHGPTRSCSNRLSVRFDDSGSATFQYLITDEAARRAGDDERCRLSDALCTIEVVVGGETSVVDTVFVDVAPPPGRIEVEPTHDLQVGDMVTVGARELPPGAHLTIMVCAAPARDTSRCGAPGPTVPLTIGADGAAEKTFALDVAAVGTDEVACGRRAKCLLVARSDEIGVRAPPVTLSFAAAPTASYEAVRLALGAAIAGALLLAVAGLLRFTNWSPPLESDSSSLDEAELADLDREVAELEEPVSVSEGSSPTKP